MTLCACSNSPLCRDGIAAIKPTKPRQTPRHCLILHGVGGWRCDHLLTAMETPANGQRVWRFTPRDGQPSRHVTQKGPNVTLTLALPYKGDGHPPVVFEQASVHHRTPYPSLLQRQTKVA